MGILPVLCNYTECYLTVQSCDNPCRFGAEF